MEDLIGVDPVAAAPVSAPSAPPRRPAPSMDDEGMAETARKKSALSRERKVKSARRASEDDDSAEGRRERAQKKQKEANAKKKELGTTAVKLLKKHAGKPEVEHLVPSKTNERMLHCNLCGGHDFQTKSFNWHQHVRSAGHQQRLEELKKQQRFEAQKAEEQKELRQARLQFIGGSKKDDAVAQHRQRVLRALVKGSVTDTQLDGDLRELMEEQRDQRLTIGDRAHLYRDHLAGVVQLELIERQRRYQGLLLSAFADASPRFAEAFLIGLRGCTEDFRIHMDVIDFQLFDVPLNGDDYFRLVNGAFTIFGVPYDKIVCLNLDRGGANGPMWQHMKPLLTRCEVGWCFAHAFDGFSKAFLCPAATAFLKAWNKTFSKSAAARRIFYDLAGEAVVRTHAIRWGTKGHQAEQIQRKWLCIDRLIARLKADGIAQKGVALLQKAWEGQSEIYSDLSLEINTFADLSTHFIRGNLLAQGDAFVSPFMYNVVNSITGLLKQIEESPSVGAFLPNVAAVFANAPLSFNRTVGWAKVKQMLKPAMVKWSNLFIRANEDPETKVSFGGDIRVFRFARLFNPQFALEWMERPNNPFQFQQERKLPEVRKILTDTLLDRMQQELPQLLALYNVNRDCKFEPLELLRFWRANRAAVPAWAEAARIFVLFQASSADAERGFAVWRNRVGDQQTTMLEDRQRLVVQLGYSREIE